jgi:hypothetical protein
MILLEKRSNGGCEASLESATETRRQPLESSSEREVSQEGLERQVRRTAFSDVLAELTQELVLDVLELVLEEPALGSLLLVDEGEEGRTPPLWITSKELLAYVLVKERCHFR